MSKPTASPGTLPTIFTDSGRVNLAAGIFSRNYAPDYQFSRLKSGYVHHVPPYNNLRSYTQAAFIMFAVGAFWLRVVTPVFFEPRCHVSHKNAEWLQACWDRTDPATVYRNNIINSPWAKNRIPEWNPTAYRGLAPEEKFPDAKGTFPIWYKQW